MKHKIYTAEFVTPKHPDKICDQIADAILDAYREKDPKTRGAVEVMGGHGVIKVNGEVTSSAEVQIENIVRKFAPEVSNVIVHLSKQSPEIARGVDTGGAGDQGIMVGFACDETESNMPYEYDLARSLARYVFEKYPYDGKTQVTVEKNDSGWKVKTVVASFQNARTEDLEARVKEFIPDAEEYFINPTGDWSVGGFDADAGLTGRKIVVDAYGPRVPVGGGAFSGKDYTKVDRTGAYMARKIALDYLKKRNAKEVMAVIAYAIGRRDPVKAVVTIDGESEKIEGYDLSPQAMRDTLSLDEVPFASLSDWGHFGRNFNWDRT